MKVESVWEEALAHIEARVPRHVFDTWFIPLSFNGIYDSSVKLEVPNKFFGEWLT
jgi:chromosomal replication initiation ATPase DnaA